LSLAAWLSIVAICTAGAMSPGPSLAVVIRNTVRGSRLSGVITGLAHATGILFYAFLTMTGLAVLITKSDVVFQGLKFAGAAFLCWLGWQALSSSSSAAQALADDGTPDVIQIRPVRDGILISLLNPKIILFFLALFSQFARPDAGWHEVLIITLTAGVIDAGWYIVVALFISQSTVFHFFRRYISCSEVSTRRFERWRTRSAYRLECEFSPVRAFS